MFETEGFVHLSTAKQVPQTLLRHFHGQSGLLLLRLNLAPDDPKLRFEDLTGRGEPFPHLYRPVNPDEVVSVTAVPDAKEFQDEASFVKAVRQLIEKSA